MRKRMDFDYDYDDTELVYFFSPYALKIGIYPMRLEGE
jgi:hypothetical protein